MAAFACGDDRSGLESCASSIASGGALDTATPGAREVVVTARDRAGNTRTERRAYTVVARAADRGPGSRASAPAAIAGSPANGGLAIGTARAGAGAGPLTITLAGTVVPAATGTVTARARDVRAPGAACGAGHDPPGALARDAAAPSVGPQAPDPRAPDDRLRRRHGAPRDVR